MLPTRPIFDAMMPPYCGATTLVPPLVVQVEPSAGPPAYSPKSRHVQ